MSVKQAKFSVGQIVRHTRFDYRGVIVDVDAVFEGTEQWYQRMAVSRPPKDQPWYQVLVHDAAHLTYVAERNLEADESGEEINHPLLKYFFSDFAAGAYQQPRRH